ncbi:uncharacterized protein N7529_011585 [Penicillium soppii]|uniref:uncharacterized protein n=1 Tax=Penicillium soppii TaxID=69789 RepID=UPI0025479F83|nr:uncharacterized protein N7529_011585 [Penicillium soppii]KAJ5852200.1 hypothetical protein N7529_011585 [Penicillium soppii]
MGMYHDTPVLAPIEPDSNSDNESLHLGSLGDASHTTSLTSNARNYQYENGRRYHSYHEGEYILPNDEREQDRLDLTHQIYSMLLKGELIRAPVRHPQRVLDIGTGTVQTLDRKLLVCIPIEDVTAQSNHGLIESGIDLSPIQPSWVPPNCRFEIDDFEQQWSYSQPFDFIHGRELEGSVRDHDRLFEQAFQNLKPNGWFEMATFEPNTYSDDETHLKAANFLEAINKIHESSKLFGKAMTSSPTWKGRMEKAGFANVREDIYKLPQSPWPKDPKLKELGRYNQLNVLEGIPAYTYALFTRMLGWSRAEIEVLTAGLRKELRNTTLHLYTKVRIVYGQKPE